MITSITSCRVQPTFKAPLIWTFSWGAALPSAVSAATTAISRDLRLRARTGVNVTEGEFDEQSGEVGRDLFQTGDNPLTGLPVHFLKLFPASTVALVLIIHVVPPDGYKGMVPEVRGEGKKWVDDEGGKRWRGCSVGWTAAWEDLPLRRPARHVTYRKKTTPPVDKAHMASTYEAFPPCGRPVTP